MIYKYSCPDCDLSSGSHNSATFDIHPSADCAPDAPAQVKQSISIPVLGDAIRAVCHGWAKCQKKSFQQQLESGIRYFDLRITTKKDSDEFYFCHTLYGPKVHLQYKLMIQYIFILGTWFTKSPYLLQWSPLILTVLGRQKNRYYNRMLLIEE